MAALRVRAQARTEITEILAWYHERSPEAAASFLLELEDAMQRISDAPAQFPVVRGRLRRVLLPRFPYGVYFKVFASGVSVVGVIHGHRHPATWLRRAGP
jgi:plasmid stabilization system protein ParE